MNASEKTPHEIAAYNGFLSGRNCSQAVFAAFSDITGISESDALLISSAFGGGIGRTRGFCGAVSGMLMAMGKIYGDYSGDDEKSRFYARVRELMEIFRERADSTVCGELLEAAGITPTVGGEPAKRDAAFYEARPCPRLCALAARILDEYIGENQPQ